MKNTTPKTKNEIISDIKKGLIDVYYFDICWDIKQVKDPVERLELYEFLQSTLEREADELQDRINEVEAEIDELEEDEDE